MECQPGAAEGSVGRIEGGAGGRMDAVARAGDADGATAGGKEAGAGGGGDVKAIACGIEIDGAAAVVRAEVNSRVRCGRQRRLTIEVDGAAVAVRYVMPVPVEVIDPVWKVIVPAS